MPLYRTERRGCRGNSTIVFSAAEVRQGQVIFHVVHITSAGESLLDTLLFLLVVLTWL